MTTYRIEIDLNNAAFGNEDEGLELGRILRELADDCEDICCPAVRRIKDGNGNSVGQAREID